MPFPMHTCVSPVRPANPRRRSNERAKPRQGENLSRALTRISERGNTCAAQCSPEKSLLVFPPPCMKHGHCILSCGFTYINSYECIFATCACNAQLCILVQARTHREMIKVRGVITTLVHCTHKRTRGSSSPAVAKFPPSTSRFSAYVSLPFPRSEFREKHLESATT